MIHVRAEENYGKFSVTLFTENKTFQRIVNLRGTGRQNFSYSYTKKITFLKNEKNESIWNNTGGTIGPKMLTFIFATSLCGV